MTRLFSLTKVSRRVQRYYGVGRYAMKRRPAKKVVRAAWQNPERVLRATKLRNKLVQVHRIRKASTGLVLLGAASITGWSIAASRGAFHKRRKR